jgi:hypothetical protein
LNLSRHHKTVLCCALRRDAEQSSAGHCRVKPFSHHHKTVLCFAEHGAASPCPA